MRKRGGKRKEKEKKRGGQKSKLIVRRSMGNSRTNIPLKSSVPSAIVSEQYCQVWPGVVVKMDFRS